MMTKLQERTTEVEQIVADAIDQGIIVPGEGQLPEYVRPSWISGYWCKTMPSYSWWRKNGRLVLLRDPEVTDKIKVAPDALSLA